MIYLAQTNVLYRSDEKDTAVESTTARSPEWRAEGDSAYVVVSFLASTDTAATSTHS